MNLRCFCGKQYGGSSNIKNRTTYDPEILLLNIYPKKTKALVQKGTSTETESRLRIAWAGEGGAGWGVTVRLWGDEIIYGERSEVCEYMKNHSFYNLYGWMLWYVNSISIKLLKKEVEQSFNSINPKKFMSRHIIINFRKLKTKKTWLFHLWNNLRNDNTNGVGLSSETMEAGSGATFSSTERKELLVLNSISHKNFCQEWKRCEIKENEKKVLQQTYPEDRANRSFWKRKEILEH